MLAATNPSVQNDNVNSFLNRRVTRVPDKIPAQAGPVGRRNEHNSHRSDADRGAEPEGEPDTRVFDYIVEHVPVGTGCRQRQQRRNDDQVRQDRAPRRCKETTAAIEESVGYPGQPVEQDLDKKDPRQCCSDRPEQLRVDVGINSGGERPEDKGCRYDGDDHGGGDDDERRRDHHVSRLVVVVCVERREQRNERG